MADPGGRRYVPRTQGKRARAAPPGRHAIGAQSQIERDRGLTRRRIGDIDNNKVMNTFISSPDPVSSREAPSSPGVYRTCGNRRAEALAIGKTFGAVGWVGRGRDITRDVMVDLSRYAGGVSAKTHLLSASGPFPLPRDTASAWYLLCPLGPSGGMGLPWERQVGGKATSVAMG